MPRRSARHGFRHGFVLTPKNRFAAAFIFFEQQLLHTDAFGDPHATLHGRLGQSHRALTWHHAAIAGQVDATLQVVDVEHRPVVSTSSRGNHFCFNTEHIRHRGVALKLIHPFLGSRQLEASTLQPSRIVPRFSFQPGIQLRGRFVDPRLGGAAAKLAYLPRRMPGRPGGDLVLLQQPHVAPAGLGEVVRQRTACDAAADNEDSCRIRNVRSGNLELSFDGACFRKLFSQSSSNLSLSVSLDSHPSVQRTSYQIPHSIKRPTREFQVLAIRVVFQVHRSH